MWRGTKNRLWFAILLCAGAGGGFAAPGVPADSIAPDTVDISGKVVDAGNGGIKDAIVTVLGDAKQDTTDSFGAFSLHYPRYAQAVTSSPRRAKMTRPAVRFSDAAVTFDLPFNSSVISLDLFGSSGCRVQRCMFHGMTAGVHSVKMDALFDRRPAQGVYVVRVGVDGVWLQGTIFIGAHERTGATRFSSPDVASANQPKASSLRKSKSVVLAADTLQISREGFEVQKIPLTVQDLAGAKPFDIILYKSCAAKPDAPANLRIGLCPGVVCFDSAASHTSISLAWDSAGCADSYRVYLKNSSGFSRLDSASIAGPTAMLDLSESCGGTFTFVVTAWNRLGESAYSNEFQVLTAQ